MQKDMLDIGHRTMTYLDNRAAGGQQSVSIYKLMLVKASETASVVNEDLKLGLFFAFWNKSRTFWQNFGTGSELELNGI